MGLSAAASLFLVVLFCAALQIYSKWSVTCRPETICALKGSMVVIQCDYSHPYLESHILIKVERRFWFTKTDKDPVDVQTQEEYAGRVEMDCLLKSCTLTIKDVKESDSAVYRFRFTTNIPGGSYTGERGVKLSVTDSDPHLSITTTSNYNLVCSSLCNLPTQSTYVWYRNGNKDNTNKHKYFTSNKLSGSFSCAVKGHEDFPSPPSCTRGFFCYKVTYRDRRICAVKGSSVIIHSTFNSYYYKAFWFSPERSGEWKNPLQPENLEGDPQYAGRVHVTSIQQQSTLTINNVRESDSQYRVIFQNRYIDWGSDLHGTTVIILAFRVQVERISANRETVFAELKCYSSCTPATFNSYTWFRNGQNLHHSKSTYKGLIGTTDKISCALSPHEQHRSPEVYAPASTSMSAVTSGDNVEGDDVVLLCSSEANPPANHTWYKKTKTSTLPVHSEGPQFSLINIQSSDSGQYFCVAENQLGNRTSMYLNVDVKYAPKSVDVLLTHTEVEEGTSRNLTCSSDGNPAPLYSWFKDNQRIGPNQESLYQLTSVTSEDSGMYHCEAKNIYGMLNSSSVHINVEFSPRLPSVSVNPPGEIAVGGSVNLTCSSVAIPAPTYAWYSEHSTSPTAYGELFTIMDIRHEHGGNFYCQARNSRGHHNSTLHLIVVSSSAASAVAGSFVFILLVVLFLSAFIIFRKMTPARKISETREKPGDEEMKNVDNLGRQLETSVTETHVNSTDEDDLCYANVHYTKKQDEPLYSNFMPTESITSQKEEDEVVYSMVMIKN